MRRCYSVSGLVEEMQNVTGLSSVREAFAWERSLLTLPTLLGPIAGLRTPQRLFRLFLRVICLLGRRRKGTPPHER